MLKRGFKCALNIGPWLIFSIYIQTRYLAQSCKVSNIFISKIDTSSTFLLNLT
jgi:hypothetical protein